MPAAFTNAGDTLTSNEYDLLPRGVVALATKTSDQASISTMADITSLSATFTAVAGRRYRITLTGLLGNNSGGAGTTLSAYIRNGSSTTLQTAQTTAYTSGITQSIMTTVVDAPGAGSVTYKASAAVSSGTMTYFASATYPATLLVEDIGST